MGGDRLTILCDLLDRIRGHIAVDEMCYEVAEDDDLKDVLDDEDRETLERIGDSLSAFWNDMAHMCDKYYDRKNGRKAKEIGDES